MRVNQVVRLELSCLGTVRLRNIVRVELVDTDEGFGRITVLVERDRAGDALVIDILAVALEGDAACVVEALSALLGHCLEFSCDCCSVNASRCICGEGRPAEFWGPTMSQLMLTALFALSISFLTFAASFAEAPRSEFVPPETALAR